MGHEKPRPDWCPVGAYLCYFFFLPPPLPLGASGLLPFLWPWLRAAAALMLAACWASAPLARLAAVLPVLRMASGFEKRRNGWAGRRRGSGAGGSLGAVSRISSSAVAMDRSEEHTSELQSQFHLV